MLFLGLGRWAVHGVCHLPAGQLLGMVTSIWCRDRLQCTPATVLFFMQVRLPKPLWPLPRSAGVSLRVRHRGSPSREYGSKIRSAESPISCPRPYRPRGNDQTGPELLAACSSRRPSCAFGPSRNGANSCTPVSARSVIATERIIGYGGPFRVWGSRTQLVANLLEHARSSHTFPLTLAQLTQPHGLVLFSR